MRWLFLFLIVTVVGVPAYGAECKHSADTAKTALAAIFSAEKAFHNEYDSYTDGFFEIGYDPEEMQTCDHSNWAVSIDQSADSAKFVARARSKITGEEWVIDEKKDLKTIKQ